MENKIVYDNVRKYIGELITETGPKELVSYARENHIPIITPDTERFLEVLLSVQQPSEILEIGTAIGYSAIFFATASKAHITTLEIDPQMYEAAKKNIEKYGLSDRIEIIFGDAAETLPDIDKKFDFIFMDAAKGQYNEFFTLADPLLKSGGILISDNILFKGTVGERLIINVERSKRAIVRGLWKYLYNLTHNENYKTSILSIGDGVAFSKKL